MKRIKTIRQRLSLAFFILLQGDVDMLVTVYVTLIIAGRRTLETTPYTLKEAVSEELTTLGLDGEGKPV